MRKPKPLALVVDPASGTLRALVASLRKQGLDTVVVRDRAGLARALADAEQRLDPSPRRDRLVGRSRAMAKVIEQVAQVASSRAAVLLEGEPGTGKERIARAIHAAGGRRAQRFEVVHGATLQESRIGAVLFGAAGEGPDDGAARVRLAEGGTLLIDDIDRVPPDVQLKLLRLLQERVIEGPDGGPLRVDVRLIATTARDLTAEVAAGRFRADLLQRLSAVRIPLPPLRERSEDISPLTDAFLKELNREHGRRVRGITRGAQERLSLHDWPGNVRELRATLEDMVVHAEGRRPLDLSDLPARMRASARADETLVLAVGMTVGEAERQLIAATLRHTGNDKVRAAAMLGIGLRTLYRKVGPSRR
jgi:DNA-binding NtrC family response regulator